MTLHKHGRIARKAAFGSLHPFWKKKSMKRVQDKMVQVRSPLIFAHIRAAGP